MGNQPIKKWKAGSIEVAVWENERETGSGSVSFKTISLTRSWKKKDENIWRHDVLNLRRNDIQKAILVLQKAQEDLLLVDRKEEDDTDE